MSDFPFKAVGFDLDGTLLDTFRDLGAAVNHALELGGFDPVPVGSSKDLIGGGAKIMLAQAVEAQGGMSEEDFRALYKAMLRYYAEHNAVHSAPYPHAREVVADLTSRGVKVAVVTNKFEEFARSILAQLDFIDPFETVIGGDTMGKGEDGRFLSKPHPEPVLYAMKLLGSKPEETIFVGDSPHDMASGRAAGVKTAAVLWGPFDRDQLAPHSPDYWIETPADLTKL